MGRAGLTGPAPLPWGVLIYEMLTGLRLFERTVTVYLELAKGPTPALEKLPS